MSATSDAVRKMFKEGDDIRDAGLDTPPDVVRVDDLRYASDDPCQLLDVYRPRERDGEVFPVIVSVHGGGWVYGDKERYQWYCMSLAQRGFAVVNFTYRLAPEHTFPASMTDTYSAFAWVLEHADEYLLDKDRVFAVGDSAGARMLSMYAIACTDATYAGKLGIRTPQGFVPSAVALNCGAYRITIPEHKTGDMMLDLTANLMQDLLPEGGTAAVCALISPIDHLNERFPPAFVMTADGDFLAPDALPLVRALMDLNVEVNFHYYQSNERELGHVFHCNMRLTEAHTCNDDECAFFHSHLS
ncbi:MAG: alpha/beta hydrolase [Coriobacteriales bacterium]|nr:alpha/beta hydrolase [Coriobacteriales bacterium]